VTVFPMPDVIRYHRTCRDCGDPWCVYCAFGASEPPRDPYYRCPECRAPAVEATADRVAVIEARRAQLSIVKDESVE